MHYFLFLFIYIYIYFFIFILFYFFAPWLVPMHDNAQLESCELQE